MEDVSAIAVTFQAAGSILLAVIIGQLARIFSSAPARWWSMAWFSFAAGLICVRLFVLTNAVAISMAYLVFEWIFLLLLWSGCRELTGRVTLRARYVAYALPLALAIALTLATTAESFNEVFIVEAAIMALGAFGCFHELSKTIGVSAAVRIMRAALLAFATLYALYVPLFLIHERFVALPLLSYSSFADLLVSVFVGCTMILVIAEGEDRRTKDIVSELEQARSLIEKRLHTDALTEALNRHAYHWMKQGAEIATDGVLSGVVVMIDIDNLKQINDAFGHHAGDLVIRAAANAIRSVIRGDDLLFRWGGDEFVAILPNLTKEVVSERLAAFDRTIVARLENGSAINSSITWGQAEFGAQQTIDQAIKVADDHMYEARRNR